jgi:CubicO group peptidase (beta-lactamase class C family)
MKTIVFSTIAFLLIHAACQNDKSADLPVEISAIEAGLRPVIQVKGDSLIQYSIVERMEHYKVPGLSIAVVENGKVKWAKGYGIANSDSGTKVDVNTLFQAGSISKPIAALSALKLAENGDIDLDEDVNEYLKDWQIPENDFMKEEKVTLRRLLTHTAGMTVHGFPGYQQNDTFPSNEDVLKGNGNTGAIYVDTVPGSIWRYSGGGYTVMEQVVEDISGFPFEEYMAKYILNPIGMKNSTYEQPLPSGLHSNASAAYDYEGEIIEGLWHNYPEQAAAGLWTTPTDLAKYCIEIQEIISGNIDGVLSKETIEQMITKHKGDWGLGVALKWDHDSLIFQHGGKNAGFTNDMNSFAYQGNAVIIMTNADNGGDLIGEILRSISYYYGWGLAKQRVVEAIELPVEKLNKLTGRYKLDFQVPGIGDYYLEVTLKGQNLFVFNPNENTSSKLIALEELKFVYIKGGDEVEFQVDESSGITGFLSHGQYQFDKTDR